MLLAKADIRLVQLASLTRIPEIRQAGVRLFLYRASFLHRKLLVMNDVGMIGTVNLDNRSLRLNFQITLAFAHADFAPEIAVMLERDFARCDEPDELYVHRLPLHTRIGAHCARLLASVL